MNNGNNNDRRRTDEDISKYNYNDYNNPRNNNIDMTIIGAQRDQEMGLDLSSFNNNAMDTTVNNISTTNDLPIIEKVYSYIKLDK